MISAQEGKTEAYLAVFPQTLKGSAASIPAREPVQFVRASSIDARGRNLATQIDSNGTSRAHAAELLERYDIPYDWDATHSRLLIGALDVVPLYLDDAVQASVGWPLFEMPLQHGNAPVILRGILREDRAWCRVLEFAEEFQITASFEPFALGERRGG